MSTASRSLRHQGLRLTIAVAGALILICGYPVASVAIAQTAGPDRPAHFAYDKRALLDMKQVSVNTQDGVTIHDITYAGPNGEVVPAYLVIPSGEGKFAVVIWGHWLMPGSTNSNRDEFLEEAIALAPAGVISLLIDAPQARPNFKPTPTPVLVTEQVIDLRRGLDLLLSRPDIDPGRIAYVGHSWGRGPEMRRLYAAAAEPVTAVTLGQVKAGAHASDLTT